MGQVQSNSGSTGLEVEHELKGKWAKLKALQRKQPGSDPLVLCFPFPRPKQTLDRAGSDSVHAPAPGGRPPYDSASSGHALSFITWAKEQSARRRMSLDDFVVEQCKSGLEACPVMPDNSGLIELLAAASHSRSAQQFSSPAAASQQVEVQPFAPHIGYLKGPPKPHCHEDRIAAANGINALRRTRDGEIESVLRLLCRVFDVETSTVALLTGEAIYLTGACGALPVCICPDRWGFCGWSFLNSHHELLVVEDMDADARFNNNYFVCEPQFHLKFYVAAPLISSNNHRLGTLCVMGTEPRKFDALRGQLLANMAEMLVRQLEQRWVAKLQASGSAAVLMRSLHCYDAAYLVLDLSCQPWAILHMNEKAREITGIDWTASYAELADYANGRMHKQQFDGTPFNSIFDLSGATLTWNSGGGWEFKLSGLKLAAASVAADAAVPESQCTNSGAWASEINNTVEGAAVASVAYSLICRHAISDGLDESQPFFVGVPSWLALSGDNTWGRNYFFARLAIEDENASNSGQQCRGRIGHQFKDDSAEQLTELVAKWSRQDSSTLTSPVTSSADNLSLGELSAANQLSDSASTLTSAWLPRGIFLDSMDSSSVLTVATSTSSRLSSTGGDGSRHSGSLDGPGSCRSSLEQQSKSLSSANGTGGGGTALADVVPVVTKGLPLLGLVMGPLVGKGSYGRVYRGLLKGQPVAVKIIDDIRNLRMTPSGEPLEISLTRNMKHMGIMSSISYTYSDAGEVPKMTTVQHGRSGSRKHAASANKVAAPAKSVCWMLFEYCDKGVLVDGVLRGWFRTSPSPFTGSPHLRVIGLTALEIASAMKHLHEQGVVHGDLCGGNIMLASSTSNPHGFTAKVGDFGLARINKDQASAALHPVDQRLADNNYGTITHMPPEVLLDGVPAFGPAADVYAWGVLLWEMLTGTRAWAGMTGPAVVCQIAVLKRSLAIPKNLPPVLEELLCLALSPNPQIRPSFAMIVRKLTGFVQQSRAVDWEEWQAAVNAAHAKVAQDFDLLECQKQAQV